MFRPKISKNFKRDVEKARRQKKNLELLDKVIHVLLSGGQLDPIYQDHPLKGKWQGFRDCHITSDWVLIYKISPDEKIIRFERLASHAEFYSYRLHVRFLHLYLLE